MKLLFLVKRRPQGRDLLTRPYGRFYHIPTFLARRGHAVRVLLLSYRNEANVEVQQEGAVWTSSSILGFRPARYLSVAGALMEDWAPDWVVGFSDTYYGVLAHYLASRYGARSAIDAYDNYESYAPWLKPVHWAWRRAVANADLVTAAGPNLAALLGRDRQARPTVVLPMAADPVFRSMDRSVCRRDLGLPEERKLIGYLGAIYDNRGIYNLFEAYQQIRKEVGNVELVLSGRTEKAYRLPKGSRWLGHLPDEQVPVLLNAVDAVAVINRTSAFGNYSYPAKLYEAMCCRVPAVATSTPASSWILKDNPELLVAPGDPSDLKEKLKAALLLGRVDYGPQADWETITRSFEKALAQCGRSSDERKRPQARSPAAGDA